MGSVINITEQNHNKQFFIIAGEESGDLHGARLVKELRQQAPDIGFIGHGGDQLAAAGVELIEHIDDLAVMGFTEVIKHLTYFNRVMKKTVTTIENRYPARVILIDYPGFNLRLARKIFHLGIPVTYFILPQVWAWKEGRVKIIRRYIDQVLSIFPFEEAWFKKRKVTAKFVGHPFAEQAPPELSKEAFLTKHGLAQDTKLLVIFPGSRQQEVDRLWPVFIQAAQEIASANSDISIIIGRAPNIELASIPDDIRIESDNPRLALRYGQAALVASGTATLEAAVNDIPAVVAYRLSNPTYYLARLLVNLPLVSMINLIAGKQVVPELIQSRLTVKNIRQAVEPLLVDTAERKNQLAGFAAIREALGEPGAYKRAAAAILAETP